MQLHGSLHVKICWFLDKQICLLWGRMYLKTISIVLSASRSMVLKRSGSNIACCSTKKISYSLWRQVNYVVQFCYNLAIQLLMYSTLTNLSDCTISQPIWRLLFGWGLPPGKLELCVLPTLWLQILFIVMRECTKSQPPQRLWCGQPPIAPMELCLFDTLGLQMLFAGLGMAPTLGKFPWLLLLLLLLVGFIASAIQLGIRQFSLAKKTISDVAVSGVDPKLQMVVS